MDVTHLPDQLVERAFLHNDPDAYLAGVKDAVSLLVELDADDDAPAPVVSGA